MAQRLQLMGQPNYANDFTSTLHEYLGGIDWVIVGGESGPGARPIQKEWVTDIRDQCLAAGVSFFFKQWGGVHKKCAGRVLDGRTWDELPIKDIAA